MLVGPVLVSPGMSKGDNNFPGFAGHASPEVTQIPFYLVSAIQFQPMLVRVVIPHQAQNSALLPAEFQEVLVGTILMFLKVLLG